MFELLAAADDVSGTRNNDSFWYVCLLPASKVERQCGDLLPAQAASGQTQASWVSDTYDRKGARTPMTDDRHSIYNHDNFE